MICHGTTNSKHNIYQGNPEAIPLKKETRMPAINTIILTVVLEVLENVIRQGKEIRETSVGKEANYRSFQMI